MCENKSVVILAYLAGINKLISGIKYNCMTLHGNIFIHPKNGKKMTGIW